MQQQRLQRRVGVDDVDGAIGGGGNNGAQAAGGGASAPPAVVAHL
jgi:hypothetical protein